MPSVFDALDEIRKRPSMFLGGDESHRSQQLQNLEQLLSGYSIALRLHEIQEPVADFVRDFGAFIWKEKGWSVSCGPVAAVREVTKTDQEAWNLFWTLVDEFHETVEG